jgi:tetratricopeptide (TPR) repeat protein
MGDPISLASTLTTIGSELSKLAPWTWKHLPQNSPVRSAMRKTAARFSTRLPNFEQSLELWVVSETFRAQIDAVESGVLGDADVRHAELFIQTTGFGLTAVSLDGVRDGLLSFYHELYLILCEGDQGMRIIGAAIRDIQTELAEQRRERHALDAGSIPYRPSLQSDTTSRAVTKDDHDAEIELNLIKALVDRRQGSAGLALLSGLQSRVDQGQLSAGVRVRYFLNKGVCHILLGDWDAGEKEFDRARVLEPTNRKVRINLSQAAIFRGDHKTALQLAEAVLTEDQNDSNANSLRLLCLHELGRNEEIERILEAQPSLAESVFCLYTLAFIAADLEKFDEAEHYLRRHNEIDATHFEAWELLGRVIVIPAQRVLKETAASTEWIPDDIRHRLEEAELCFSRASELLSATDNRHELTFILANRGMTLGLLGQYENARRDNEQALALDPSQDLIKSNLVRLHLTGGRPADAIAVLETIQSQEIRLDIGPTAATAYLELKNPDAARKVLESLGSTTSRPDHLVILGLKLQVSDQLGDGDATREILNFISGITGNSEARRIVAEHYFRRGNLDEAIRLLRLAMDEADPSRLARYRLALADTLYRSRRFGDAAQEYEQVPVPAYKSPECMRYLVSLFCAGRFNRALELATTVRQNRSAIPNFSEIEAMIYEQLGDLDRAMSLRRELLGQSVAPAHQKLKMALSHFRRGRIPEAASLALEVGLSAVLDDADSLQDAATLRTLMELPDALDFAYQLLEVAHDDPDVHLFYINTFFRREKIDDNLFHPQTVGAGCSVVLRQGSQARLITVVRGESQITKDWLSENHELVAKMIGLGAGASFRFPPDGPGSFEYRIETIQSKFVAAFQDCLDRFNERFPSAYGLTKVEFNLHDPTQMVMMLERHRAHGERILDLYRAGKFPACTISRLLGKSNVELFRTLVEDRRMRIHSFDGSPGGLAREHGLLDMAKSILLESSALVTLASLNLLERVAGGFDSVKVTQQTVDSLNETILKLFPEKQSGSLYSDTPGHVEMVSRTSEEILQEQSFYQRLVDFLRSRCEIIAPCATQEFEGPEIRKLLGAVAVSTLAAVKTSQLLMVSDDLPLNILAGNTHSIQSVGTLSVLRHLRRKAVMPEEEYHIAVQWLVDRGFVFVSIDKTDILSVLRKANWSPTAEVAMFLQSLAGPDCNTNAALSIVLEVLIEIWSEPLSFATSQLLSDLLLRALVSGRNAGQVLRLLEVLNGRRSLLWTPAQQQIQNLIRSWNPRGRPGS